MLPTETFDGCLIKLKIQKKQQVFLVFPPRGATAAGGIRGGGTNSALGRATTGDIDFQGEMAKTSRHHLDMAAPKFKPRSD